MPFRGRHRVIVIFWPWDHPPFATTTDIVQCTVSKSCGSGSKARLTLFPRRVPIDVDFEGREERDNNRSYMDVLKPNDWVFMYVDPGDGDTPEPLFLGMIDRVSRDRSLDKQGRVRYAIDVAASGWEKSLKNSMVVSNPWISHEIGIPTLIELGPAGSASGVRSRDASEPIPGVQLWQDLVENIIEWLVGLFLRSDGSPGVDADRARGEVEGAIDASLRTDEDDGESSREETRIISPILGQYELPGSGYPLWYFLTLRFQELGQRSIVNPMMFMNQKSVTLANLIDMFSNPLLNMVLYDVRRVEQDGLSDLQNRLDSSATGGYSASAIADFIDAARDVNVSVGDMVADISPMMILRERPLFVDELLELDGPELHERDFVNMNLGMSDTDYHNLVIVDTQELAQNQQVRVNSGFAGFRENRQETLDHIRRHGLRLYQDQVSAWPERFSASYANPEVVRDWEIRIHRAGMEDIENWTGQAVVPKYVRGSYLGGKLLIHHLDEVDKSGDGTRVYFVDGLDFSYVNPGGFSTSFALTRGRLTEE